MYPMRFPFSGLLGNIGVPLIAIVNVTYDKEANVYIATSNDIKGLIVEASSFEELKSEVEQILPELISSNRPNVHNFPTTDISFRQHLFA